MPDHAYFESDGAALALHRQSTERANWATAVDPARSRDPIVDTIPKSAGGHMTGNSLTRHSSGVSAASREFIHMLAEIAVQQYLQATESPEEPAEGQVEVKA